jgi:hypothetical protein
MTTVCGHLLIIREVRRHFHSFYLPCLVDYSMKRDGRSFEHRTLEVIRLMAVEESMKNRGVLFRRLRPLLGHRSHWLPIPGTIFRKCRGGRRRGSERGSAREGARLPASIASAASCRSAC